MASWTFVYVGDIQPGSPGSFRYNPRWIENWHTCREQIIDCQPDLLLVGGDLTRDGSFHRYELVEMKADLDALPFPAHVIPGNMDTGNKHAAHDGYKYNVQQEDDTRLNVTSAQLQQFASVYGPLWWSVVHKGVRFSGGPDMAINSGLPEEEAFWIWAEALKQQPRESHHVWITHYPPFIEQPDEPNWDNRKAEHKRNWYFSIDLPGRQRLIDLFQATGVDLVISGHVHCYKTFVFDDIRYVIAPAPSFGQFGDRWPDGDDALGFLRYDVTETGLKETFAPLAKVSTAEGAYGPGGHPKPELRDYSLAWEKGGC